MITRGYPGEFEIWTWKCYNKRHIIRNKDKWHTAQDKDDDCDCYDEDEDEDEDEEDYDGYDGYDDQ